MHYNHKHHCYINHCRPGKVLILTTGILSYLHGKGLSTASMRTGEGPQLLMEGANVVLQVEWCGEGPFTTLSGTFQHQAHLRVNLLVLLQKPRIPEHLVALVTRQKNLKDKKIQI